MYGHNVVSVAEVAAEVAGGAKSVEDRALRARIRNRIWRLLRLCVFVGRGKGRLKAYWRATGGRGRPELYRRWRRHSRTASNAFRHSSKSPSAAESNGWTGFFPCWPTAEYANDSPPHPMRCRALKRLQCGGSPNTFPKAI